jgi:hypothetical protein
LKLRFEIQNVTFWKVYSSLVELQVPDTLDFSSMPLDPTMSAFLGGVLARLPSVMCLTHPAPKQPGSFWIWGFGNREVGPRGACMLITPGRGEAIAQAPKGEVKASKDTWEGPKNVECHVLICRSALAAR